MKRDVRSGSTTSVSGKDGSAGGVLASLADTTWRVAVPTVLFAGIGIAIDNTLETMPLCTLIGLVLGLIAAGALVWHQIQHITTTEVTK